MAVLVTGGAGFLGSFIVHRLIKEREEVFVLDKTPFSACWRLSGVIDEDKYIKADLSQKPHVEKELKDIETIFHFASTSTPSSTIDDIAADFSGNVLGSLNLFEQAVSAGVNKVVFASSGGQMYSSLSEGKAAESRVADPVTPYGISKLTIEHSLKYFQRTHGLDVIITRIGNPYGPRQTGVDAPGVIALFLDHLLKGTQPKLFNEGKAVRDFIYIDDFIDGLLKLADSTPKESTFNLGSGIGTSISNLTKIIEQVSGKQLNCKLSGKRSEDVPYNVLDITKMSKQTGWSPKIELKEGVARTWEWIKQTS